MSTRKTNVELKSDREVIITRVFAAPAHLVWEAMAKAVRTRKVANAKTADCARASRTTTVIDQYLAQLPEPTVRPRTTAVSTL